MKRILALLLCFCLCVSLIPAAMAEDPEDIIILEEEYLDEGGELITIVDPEAPGNEPADNGLPASGKCGDDLTWDLTSGGSLMISGTGDMYDYTADPAPWMAYESASSSGFHIQNVSIDDGVTSVGNYAFDGLTGVKNIALGNTISRIGIAAFRGCGIYTLSLPDSLTRIRANAFENCDSLFSVFIPASVTDIQGGAFADCNVLSHFSVSEDNSLYCAIDDVLFSNNGKSLIAFPEGKGNTAPAEGVAYYSIPDGTTCIETSAFMGNASLQSVDFPAGLLEIGNNAFAGCTNLQSANLPSSVEWIGSYAFEGCINLLHIGLPEGITTAPRGMCRNCFSLHSVSLPATLTEIAYGAFEGCSSLTGVYLPGLLELIDCCAFKDSGLTDVRIPNSVTDIVSEAFMGCWELEYIVFGTGIQNIGKWVVSGCDALDRVFFLGGAPSFNAYAFESMALHGDPAYPISFTAWYPSDVSGWTSSVRRDYGGSVTWESYAGGFVIVEQPESMTVPADSYAWTNVRIACVTDVVYEWQYKTADGLSGSWKKAPAAWYDAASLHVQATEDLNGSCFRCKISGGQNAYSDTVWLTVGTEGLPVIITQPQDQAVPEGETASFSFAARGPNLIFEWQYNTNPDDPVWRKCSGSGAATLELQVVAKSYRDGYQYRCRVYNTAATVYTNAASLTLLAKPVITTQPKSITAASGETATFKVKATGGSLSYQWQYRTSSSGTWKNSSGSGATSASYPVGAASYRDGYQYRCKVTNAAGTAISSAATLTVVDMLKPKITAQPKSVEATSGTTVNFSVTATGGGLRYQWQFMNPSTGAWANCSGEGATAAKLPVEVKSYRDGYQYRCKVSNDLGSVTSEAATLTLKTIAKPTITKQPSSVTAKAGETATFSITATGSGTLTYQWYYRAKPENAWAKCTGGTGKSLSVEVKGYRSGYEYYCAVTNAGGTTKSNTVTLTVRTVEKPVITQQPSSLTYPVGGTASFSVKATGEGTLSYQWYYRAKEDNAWAKCTGGTGTTLPVEAKSYRNGYQYRCGVTNEGGTVYTVTVTLTVTSAQLLP